MPRTPPFHVLFDATGTFVSPQPGILLAWRESDRGWEAWVVSAGAYSTGTGSDVSVRQGWVPAHLVRPV